MRILAFLFLAASSATLMAGELRYRVDVLDPLPGGRCAIPTDINDLGQVVGYVQMPDGPNIAHSRPVIWDNSSTPTLLWDDGFAPGFKGGRSWAINNHGVIVGQAQASSYTGTPLPTNLVPDGRAFVWDAVNGLQRLVHPAQYAGYSEAVDINDAGQVLGNVSPPDTGEHHGIVWSADGELTLIPECQQHSCIAESINNAGHVAGNYYNDDFRVTGFFWNGGDEFLPLTPEGFRASQVYSMNERGDILGKVIDPVGSFAQFQVLWNRETGLTFVDDLPGPPVPDPKRILRILDNGELLGNSDQGAYFWSPEEVRYLSDMIDDDRPWEYIGGVTAVNRKGQIVGGGLSGGEFSLVLLTPVPEPSACSLALTMSIIGFLVRRTPRVPQRLRCREHVFNETKDV